MRMINLAKILFIFGVIAFTAAAQTLKTRLDTLIEAERAFSRLSVEKGMRDSFLANLNDDSILFRPQAVPGKAWMEKSPLSNARLSWTPEFADIARSGDLGYTTGPWEIRRSPQEEPSGFGHYVTVWKRQQDGAWKIAVDIGISHERVPAPNKVVSPAVASNIQNAGSNQDSKAPRETLMEIERKLPADGQAYLDRFQSDALLFRDGKLPYVGIRNVRQALMNNKTPFTWKVQDADVSAAGDMGYAYGSAGSKDGEPVNYLRIWKRQAKGEWKLVLDLVG
jgi:ketosteroid isomerase-like protein